MDPEMRAAVVEMLESRGADASQRELRARFYEFAGIAAGRRVIEVGCGTGVDTRAMAGLVAPGGSVLGVDPSETLLVEARRRTPEGLEARYEQGSGDKLPLRESSVDRAVAITTLSHLSDPRPVIAEMTRVARPGGRVALFDHDMGTFVIDSADRETTRVIFDRYTREVSGMDAGRRLVGLLKEAGLRAVQAVALPLLDTQFSSYFQFVVERYPLRAVEDGALTPQAADAWRRDVRERAAAGRFFGSVVYFAACGVK
jgi:SAM-dependent methyltransferase